MRIKGDDEFTVAREQLDDICYQIAAIPSAGAVGLAVKAFLRHWVEENELFPLDKAILEDAARLVPETAPLVAEWLEHDRQRPASRRPAASRRRPASLIAAPGATSIEAITSPVIDPQQDRPPLSSTSARPRVQPATLQKLRRVGRGGAEFRPPPPLGPGISPSSPELFPPRSRKEQRTHDERELRMRHSSRAWHGC